MTAVRTAADIGHVIAAIRKARGWSQAELAAKASLTQPKVSEIENGKPTARIELALRLIEAMGLEIDIREPGTKAEGNGLKSAPATANIIFDEPLPDDSIDIDDIVGAPRVKR